MDVKFLPPAPATEIPPCPGSERILAIGEEARLILQEAGIPALVGGGIALWAYGRRRCTKDMDLFIPWQCPEDALNVLARHGFHTRDTDARWLYKAIKQDVLIDLIVYTTGNIRLDEETFRRSRTFSLDQYLLPVLGPEDLLFRKILSFREDTPKDWFDALSIVCPTLVEFDWDYFLDRVGDRHAGRALSFLIFAQSECGKACAPSQALEALLERWRQLPGQQEDCRPGPVTFAPADVEV